MKIDIKSFLSKFKPTSRKGELREFGNLELPFIETRGFCVYETTSDSKGLDVAEDCVVLYSGKFNSLALGKEYGYFILTPKGWKKLRGLVSKELTKYQPCVGAFKTKLENNSIWSGLSGYDTDRLTMRHLDAYYESMWNYVNTNTEARLQRRLAKAQKLLDSSKIDHPTA